MSLSVEEQTLRELKFMNAQINPGVAFVKALGLIAALGVIFCTLALVVNGALHAPVTSSPSRAKQVLRKRTERRFYIPNHKPSPKESFLI